MKTTDRVVSQMGLGEVEKRSHIDTQRLHRIVFGVGADRSERALVAGS